MSDGGLLRDFLRVVVRRRRLVVGTVLGVMVVALAGVLLLPDRYTARMTLRVATPGSLSGDPVRADATQYLDRLQNTYSSLASSDVLRNRLKRELRLAERPEVSLTPKPATELMKLEVTAGDPKVAADAANALAAILGDEVRRLETAPQSLTTLDEIFTRSLSSLESEIARSREEKATLEQTPNPSDAVRQKLLQLQTDIDVNSVAAGQQRARYDQLRAALIGGPKLLTVVNPAVPPTAPNRPTLVVTAALSLAVGLVAALGLAAVFERLRTSVDRRNEVEDAAGVPVVAELEVPPREGRPEILGDDATGAEGFRRLRTEVLVELEQRNVRSLLMTSVEREQEAGWVAVNLAVALARAGQRVVIVDGDLAAPSLHRMFGIANSNGLAEVLCEGSSFDLVALRTMVPGLTFVPAGNSIPVAGDALTPARLTKLVEELESSFDVVVVHASGLLEGAGPLAFAIALPAVLLVVVRGWTTRAQISQAAHELTKDRSCLIGAVLAGGTRRHSRLGRAARTVLKARKAAEAEAARLLDQAEAEAARIRREAEAEAERRSQEVQERLAQLRLQAESEAEALVANARREAEELLDRLRSDAERNVRAMQVRGRQELDSERSRVLSEINVEANRMREEADRLASRLVAEAQASARTLREATEHELNRARAASEAEAARQLADARRIWDEARAEATRIRASADAAAARAELRRQESEAETARILAEATERAQEVKAVAERSRREAAEEAQWLRREAEGEAMRMLADAEALLDEAKAEAAQIVAGTAPASRVGNGVTDGGRPS